MRKTLTFLRGSSPSLLPPWRHLPPCPTPDPLPTSQATKISAKHSQEYRRANRRKTSNNTKDSRRHTRRYTPPAANNDGLATPEHSPVDPPGTSWTTTRPMPPPEACTTSYSAAPPHENHPAKKQLKTKRSALLTARGNKRASTHRRRTSHGDQPRSRPPRHADYPTPITGSQCHP